MSALKTVKRFYDAVARGDVPAVVAVLDSDLNWTEAEGFPYYGGTWTSPQDVVDKLLIPLSRDWNEFAATPSDFVEADDRVVAFGAYSGTAKSTGKAMRAPFAHVWTVRNDKITRFNMYTDTVLVRAALA